MQLDREHIGTPPQKLCGNADWMVSAFLRAEGIAERVIFRALFPTGMTVFDPVEEEGAESATMSHVSARQEYRNLVAALNLPVAQVEPMRLSA